MQGVDGEAVQGQLAQAGALVQLLEHAVAVAAGQGGGVVQAQALPQVQALQLGQPHRHFHQHHAPLQVADLHIRAMSLCCMSALAG